MSAHKFDECLFTDGYSNDDFTYIICVHIVENRRAEL